MDRHERGPGVDVRGGVVTVATRTVADKREWDMVGSFRSFRDGEKPGQRCCRVGEGAACARGARGGRAVRPCPAVLMVMCTTVPPDRSGPRPDHSSAFGSGVGRYAPRPDVPRRGRSALPGEIPKLVIMVRRVERCVPPVDRMVSTARLIPQNRGRVFRNRSPSPPTGQRPTRSNRSGIVTVVRTGSARPNGSNGSPTRPNGRW